MKNNAIIISLLAFVFLYACKKETTTKIPTTIIEEPASCILKETNFKKDTTVEVWNVTDTSKGKAEAIKINKKWIGKVFCTYFKGRLGIGIITYYDMKKDWIAREVLSFSNVPKKVGCYELSKDLPLSSNILDASYYACDDDVVEARYTLDEFRAKNYLEIIKIDTINKYIEGKFMATFLKDKNNKNPWYQDTLRFANATFWAKIQ